jgi:RNA polymerase sigma factor (sigma-70 family)
MDDAAAIEAVRNGDAEAYAVLVERYQGVAFRTAYLVVRDADGAEDVAQEAFVRAYRQLGRFRIGEPFRPWLLRIVTNLALNEVRARGRRRGLLGRLRPERASREPDPARAVEQGERQRALLEAIGRLGRDDQVVLYLRHFLDLPEREIATAIGKRPGTVKSRLSRARGRLRELVEAEYRGLIPADIERVRDEPAGAGRESGAGDGE